MLRIEWRAGLAGVEETRSVHEMLDNLRRLEAGISEVGRLVSNMPVQKPAATAVPVPAPVAAEAPDWGGYDLRLAVANAAALALVALWWFRRRRPATGLQTRSAPSPENVLPAATRSTPVPSASPTMARTSLAEDPSGLPPVAAQAPVAATPEMPRDTAALEFGQTPATAPDPDPAASAEPAAPASINPPDAKPAEPFNANDTLVIDFSLEEADPEAVARENARLQAVPPVSAAKPPETPPETETNVEPTLQLAEIMLSMGLEQGAAQALIEYIETHPRHAVYHWLKLLGIYRSRGLKKEFAETAEKLRTHFNIQAEEWGAPAENKAPGLENFSRVSEHVQKIWSQPKECIGYLQHLLEDNREGARAGFPQSVAEEILFLIEILRQSQA